MSGPKHKAQASAGTRGLVILQKRPILCKIFPHLSPAFRLRPNLAQWELLSWTRIHVVPGCLSTPAHKVSGLWLMSTFQSLLPTVHANEVSTLPPPLHASPTNHQKQDTQQNPFPSKVNPAKHVFLLSIIWRCSRITSCSPKRCLNLLFL